MHNLLSKFTAQEKLLIITISLLIVIISVINPMFLSPMNIIFLTKNSMVTMTFALAFLVVLVIGGFDISFAAIGVFSMYSSLKIAISLDMNMNFGLIALMSICIGTLLGLFNGVLVHRLKVNPLIVTLGTMSLYRGFLLFFIGADYVRQLPKGISDFSRDNLFFVTASNGAKVGFHTSFIIVALIATVIALVLRFTIVGRQAYAMGGDRLSAKRAGFPIKRIEIIVYMLVGALSGYAGIMSAGFIRAADPFTLIGTELDVIAAVIIGGASIIGGKGTVLGTVLGVMMIAIVRNSLTLLSIPSYSHDMFIGGLIILAISLPTIQDKIKKLSVKYNNRSNRYEEINS
ncbi:ABC transporter permease [Photobacterium sp. DNB23_23_1]